MLRVRRALTKSQAEAVKTPLSAKTLVESMNQIIGSQKIEIVSLRENYADLQNKYEDTQRQNHKLDKANGIMIALQGSFIVTEILKLLISAVGVAYGVNVVTSGKEWGWLVVVTSILAYIMIAALIRPKRAEN